jgi:hypothetical protein
MHKWCFCVLSYETVFSNLSFSVKDIHHKQTHVIMRKYFSAFSLYQIEKEKITRCIKVSSGFKIDLYKHVSFSYFIVFT